VDQPEIAFGTLYIFCAGKNGNQPAAPQNIFMNLRVITLNVWNNQGDPRRHDIINRELRRLNPDLVSIQEVIDVPTQSQLETLQRGLNLHSTHQASVLEVQPPYSDRYGGTAVATRWHHRVVEALDLNISGGKDVPWHTLAVIVPVPGAGDLLFIGTTLSWRLSDAAVRERQAVALSDLDTRHRTSLPTIIAGDVNAAPDAACIPYMSGLQPVDGRSVKYHDAWAIAGDGPGYTWTIDNPNAQLEMERIVRQPNYRQRIDYIFVGSWDAHAKAHCRIVATSLVFNDPVEGIWLSDHFGVVADLEIGNDNQQT
jgi:endonuclease/exonuclease/phosphatase family metal-dependent hydrolase